jgi:hypothetical protein
MKKLRFMVYSYTGSLISVAAAVAEACSLYPKKNFSGVKREKSGLRKFLKLKDKFLRSKNRVGIKFDNISARKYFALIHSTQQFPVLNKSN